MIIREILRNCDLSPLDTEILLSLAIKKPREYLFAHPERKLSLSELKKFNFFAKRRQKGEPVAYITGKKEFYGLEFAVNKNVLIPRPETELLVEASLQVIMNYELGIRNIFDVGTGSGNIIISIAKNIPAKAKKGIKFHASDISRKALNIAKSNAKRHKVAECIKFIKSDLLEFLRKKKIEGNIIIVANLPYVSESLYKKNRDNLKCEPKTALISKNNGLDHYFKLLKQIKQISVASYVLRVMCYFEISPKQKNMLARIVKRELPSAKIKFFKDLSGKTRVVKIETESHAKLTKIHKS